MKQSNNRAMRPMSGMDVTPDGPGCGSTISVAGCGGR